MAHSRAIEEYKQRLRLSKHQREALVGLLLGDGYLETQNGGRTYRLKIEQSDAHRSYVQHLYELFEAWVLTPPQVKVCRSGEHTTCKWWFQTVSHGAFRFYAQQFYREGRKVVPKLIARLLKPRGLAYWFMDDGSIKSAQSKAVVLNTQGFSKEEVSRLARTLRERFALEAYLRRQQEGYQIVISGKSLDRFIELVGHYLIPDMFYKLPRKGRTTLPKR